MKLFVVCFVATSIFVLAICLPVEKEEEKVVNREKRQGSQMDPLMRNACDNSTGHGATVAPHPYACGSYLQCFNNTYSEIDCPGNMYFNTKKLQCDFRRLVKCQVIDGLVGDPNDPRFGPEVPIHVEHPPLPEDGKTESR